MSDRECEMKANEGTCFIDFRHALESIKFDDSMLARKGWNGKGMYIKLQSPDANSKMTLPYIYMHTACGNLVPWLASQTDILANDWYIVD